jgi:XTP/dITP diphosphohydrolase
VKHALLIATTNKGKLAEFRSLLADLPVEVVGPNDVFTTPPTVVEDGATFVANATKKARIFASASLMLCLADDSGLVVDALGGAPGVRSARYAHERATDGENRTALLNALDALSLDDPISIRNVNAAELARPGGLWSARFKCSLVLVDPFAENDTPFVSDGTCEGSIARTPRGSGGFGYDPLFVVEGADRTMAELSSDEKNRISHRGRAIAAMRPHLVEAIGARTRRLNALFG